MCPFERRTPWSWSWSYFSSSPSYSLWFGGSTAGGDSEAELPAPRMSAGTPRTCSSITAGGTVRAASADDFGDSACRLEAQIRCAELSVLRGRGGTESLGHVLGVLDRQPDDHEDAVGLLLKELLCRRSGNVLASLTRITRNRSRLALRLAPFPPPRWSRFAAFRYIAAPPPG